MVTADLLARRRAVVDASPDLGRLRERLAERAAPVLARVPIVPAAKALLSQDGGVCPVDGTALAFDPWNPDAHRCPRCGAVQRGERHDRWWARFQHLWVAERTAHCAALAALGDQPAAAERALFLLTAYGELYFTYPNRDNVLGPSRLFFSTYLESLWLLNYLAAAELLRAAGMLDDATERRVSQVADEAANLVGEFDERWSNRQTWNSAARAAVGVWFEDAELVRDALEGRTGLIAHLLEGFRPDGMWYEGENYHLFALRGLVTGLTWARAGGAEVMEDARLAGRLARALLAPARTALPDLSFPARKDSRFGVALAQPMYVETWEIGLAMLAEHGARGTEYEELVRWLPVLYEQQPPKPETFESYLHDADCSVPRAPCSRHELSWWSLLEILPALPEAAAPWTPGSVLLEDQGLAVLRQGPRYVSLECGPYGGGHGHPDRLHLTLHDGRVHWLADPGTGSYVSADLPWYRSTLAHNAPRLDEASQPPGGADCLAFDAQGAWGWTVGRFGDLVRTVVSGPGYVLDLVELAGSEERVLEVAWHCAGRVAMVPPGTWRPGHLASPFVERVEEFEPRDPAAPLIAVAALPGTSLEVHFLGGAQLVAARGPGRPGTEPTTFLVARVRARNARLLTVLAASSPSPGGGSAIHDVRWSGDVIEIVGAWGADRHRVGREVWRADVASGSVMLAGVRGPRPQFAPFLVLEPHEPAHGSALAIADEPPADGTMDGFDTAEPLTLELEDQYRRSEEPFAGPESFSAVAWANWTDAALYLAVAVTKPEAWFRPAGAPPLRLDNEPDDVHSDGLQVYLREPEGRGFAGFLVVPEPGGGVRVRPAGDSAADAASVRGAWRPTADGYRITLRIAWPEWLRPHAGGTIGFDLLVNEMYADRQRRAGQLVWSGGNGWVYLQGDRQHPERLGVLELIG